MDWGCPSPFILLPTPLLHSSSSFFFPSPLKCSLTSHLGPIGSLQFCEGSKSGHFAWDHAGNAGMVGENPIEPFGGEGEEMAKLAMVIGVANDIGLVDSRGGTQWKDGQREQWHNKFRDCWPNTAGQGSWPK